MTKKRLGKKKRNPRALWAIEAVRLERIVRELELKLELLGHPSVR